MGLQATLLTSAALTAEVNALKQNLERSENELSRAKKQLEDSEGKKIPCINVYKKVQLRKMIGVSWLL